MKKKNKIYKDYSKITNATKGNKNIIFIGGGIVLAILLYYFFSPYQQCVRGYVNLHYDPSANYYDHAEVKREAKAHGRIACQRR